MDTLDKFQAVFALWCLAMLGAALVTSLRIWRQPPPDDQGIT